MRRRESAELRIMFFIMAATYLNLRRGQVENLRADVLTSSRSSRLRPGGRPGPEGPEALLVRIGIPVETVPHIVGADTDGVVGGHFL